MTSDTVSVAPPTAATSPRAQAGISAETLSALLRANLNSAPHAVWSEPELRPVQADVLVHLADPSKSRHVLVVARPGVGKTHISRVAGTVERGITLVVIMLHFLSLEEDASSFVALSYASL